MYSSMGLELGLSVVVGFLIGSWLDEWLDTKPWFLLAVSYTHLTLPTTPYV